MVQAGFAVVGGPSPLNLYTPSVSHLSLGSKLFLYSELCYKVYLISALNIMSPHTIGLLTV